MTHSATGEPSAPVFFQLVSGWRLGAPISDEAVGGSLIRRIARRRANQPVVLSACRVWSPQSATHTRKNGERSGHRRCTSPVPRLRACPVVTPSGQEGRNGHPAIDRPPLASFPVCRHTGWPMKYDLPSMSTPVSTFWLRFSLVDPPHLSTSPPDNRTIQARYTKAPRNREAFGAGPGKGKQWLQRTPGFRLCQ